MTWPGEALARFGRMSVLGQASQLEVWRGGGELIQRDVTNTQTERSPD